MRFRFLLLRRESFKVEIQYEDFCALEGVRKRGGVVHTEYLQAGG